MTKKSSSLGIKAESILWKPFITGRRPGLRKSAIRGELLDAGLTYVLYLRSRWYGKGEGLSTRG
ncbi:MAG: hypothetical protein ABFE07_01890, partial [Armatimonadia bacterium]